MLYLYFFIYPKCPPFIFSFHKKYSMTTIGCFYFSLCIHLVHSTFFYITLCEFIIEHLYIEYLISLHNLSCILLFLWRINHLTLCSNSNHLWYPLIVLKCKVHVSFITFILEDEYWFKLGDVDACKMHTWTLHFITCYSMLFASYKGYIHDLYWVLGIINNFPIFLELTLRCQKTPFSIFWCFRDPNDVQMT